MSYSRWTNSRWYTFWRTGGDETRDGQIFTICAVADFTYAQLKIDLEGCLDQAVASEGTEDDLDRDELKLYMKRFLKDVEKKFPDNGLKRAAKLVKKI